MWALQNLYVCGQVRRLVGIEDVELREEMVSLNCASLSPTILDLCKAVNRGHAVNCSQAHVYSLSRIQLGWASNRWTLNVNVQPR